MLKEGKPASLNLVSQSFQVGIKRVQCSLNSLTQHWYCFKMTSSVLMQLLYGFVAFVRF